MIYIWQDLSRVLFIEEDLPGERVEALLRAQKNGVGYIAGQVPSVEWFASPEAVRLGEVAVLGEFLQYRVPEGVLEPKSELFDVLHADVAKSLVDVWRARHRRELASRERMRAQERAQSPEHLAELERRFSRYWAESDSFYEEMLAAFLAECSRRGIL